MESPSEEVRRSTHAITVQPNETVLTAFPYGPHSSLLNFLKGDPKVLGAVQILLALVIVALGAIFAFNFSNFSQRLPLVFLTGYPFWGAFIFIVTGFLTGLNSKRKCLGHGVTAMNVVSSLVAVAGVAFTMISYRNQHQFCQMPSLEGVCGIGRTYFNGILSVLLIISIVELSISVTITSFRSKCWTKSNEIVFFLPSDVTEDSELPIPEENAVIKFELQEETSSGGSTTNIQPVFFGGYTFFKLRVSRNPLAPRRSEKRGSNNTCTSLSMINEQQEEIKPKPLPAILKKRPSEDTMHTEQMNDEDLQSALKQSPEMQAQLLQDEALPLRVFPSKAVKALEALPPQALLTQSLQVQALPSETLTSHVTQSYDLISEDMPSLDTPSQDIQPQDTQSQDIPSQDTQSQDIPFQDISFLGTSSQDTPSQDMPSLGTSSQDTPSQDMPSLGTSPQDTPSQDMPSQDLPSLGTSSQDTPSQDMPSLGTSSQDTPSQDMQSLGTSPQDTPSQDMPSQDLPSLGTSSQDTPSQDMPSLGTSSQDTPSQDMPSLGTSPQDTPSQDMPSQDMPSLGTSSQDTPSQDMPSQDILSQNTPSQDMSSKDMLSQVQDLPAEAMVFEAQTFHPVQSLNEQYLEQKPLNLQLKSIQHQEEQFIYMSYQSIQSEVNLLTQEWKYEKKLPSRKSTKRHSFSGHCSQRPKKMASLKRKSIDLPIQGQLSTRKKSLEQRIKTWLFPKRQSMNKQVQVEQTAQQLPDQQAEDQLAQGEQPLKQQSQNGQGKDEQGKEEQSPKEQSKNGQDRDQQQTQHQHTGNLQANEEEFPGQLGQRQQSLIQECQDWQSPREQSPDLKTQDWHSLGQQSQGWRNKDYKVQECRLEVLHSLNWGFQPWQTQDLLEKESLRQKALYQEPRTVHDLSRYHLGRQLQDVLSQDAQYQGEDQQDLHSTGFQREDRPIDALRIRDINLRDMKSLCQNSTDQQSEVRKSDFHHSSSESSVQDMYFTYLSNANSDAQQSISLCSASYKEESPLTSCYAKNQPSEDSD